MLQLAVTADFIPGTPPVGRYLAAESGLTFARTVCLNLGFELGTDYSLTFGSADRSNRLLSHWATLRDQGIVNGQLIEIHRRTSPPVVVQRDERSLVQLMLERDGFTFCRPIRLGSFSLSPAWHGQTQGQVFCHRPYAIEEAQFFLWLEVLRNVQHPLFLRLVGWFPPDEFGPGCLITDAPSRRAAPLDDSPEDYPRPLTTLGQLLGSPRGSAWDLDQRYTAVLVIAKCMEYLHSRGFSHNGLGLSTILVDETGGLKIIGLDQAVYYGAEPGEDDAPAGSDPSPEDYTLDVTAFGKIVEALIDPVCDDLPERHQNSWAGFIRRCKRGRSSARSQVRPPTFPEIVKTLEGPDFRSQVTHAAVDQRVASMLQSSQWGFVASHARATGPGAS
jgi:hypothetical protein